MPQVVKQIEEIPSLELGEGPHWDSENKTLYFVDIFGKSIHKYEPATRNHAKADIGKVVSLIIPVQDKKDHFVISVERDLILIKWDGVSDTVTIVKKLAEVDPGTTNRINDGKCDPSGRLWTGTMGEEPEKGHIKMNQGTMVSLDNGQVKTHARQIGISNGLAWNTELKKMYYIDSATRTVDEFDFDLESGKIENRTPIFTLSKNGIEGFPDGMTIDVDGNLWVAVFDGYKVIKIDPRRPETLLDTIPIPAKQVTSVAFGGDNLDELYVTSAHFTVDGNVLPPPVHGGVFKVTGLGTKGFPGDNFVLH